MLVDTTSNERMDRISSHGYAWGYIGSTVPFIVCIALIFGGPALFGWSTTACTRASFVITALWWVAFTIPLLTSYKQVHYRATAGQAGEAIRGTFAELGSTFRAIRKNKPLWMFMIAFFFYIDAVNTVISMSTSYGCLLYTSGENALLEHRQYTKPADWRGIKVPDVLLSGDHAKVDRFRRDEALAKTNELRPDLIEALDCSKLDKADRKTLMALGWEVSGAHPRQR